MTLNPSQGGGVSTGGEWLSQGALTVALTDAARHPLKRDMEAGGIEPPSESLPPFDSTCVARVLV